MVDSQVHNANTGKHSSGKNISCPGTCSETLSTTLKGQIHGTSGEREEDEGALVREEVLKL